VSEDQLVNKENKELQEQLDQSAHWEPQDHKDQTVSQVWPDLLETVEMRDQ